MGRIKSGLYKINNNKDETGRKQCKNITIKEWARHSEAINIQYDFFCFVFRIYLTSTKTESKNITKSVHNGTKQSLVKCNFKNI